MAESFGTRVRGIESVQARLAPISGWEGVPMVILTKVSEHNPHTHRPPAHSAGVLSGLGGSGSSRSHHSRTHSCCAP
eukprot:COSAG01_NODE_331_length_18718_cov_21.881358_17_plen_77_part_00